MQILYLPEVWHCDSDGSGAAITDFGGARISDELALKKRRIQLFPRNALKVLKHFRGIITPDFSTYQDFPYPIKLYNTFRMRAFGYWIGKQGLDVINNCRWGTEESYDYCFDSIPENSIIAIGTVGGSPRKLLDRERFEKGFFEMIERLHPHTIIVYGSAKYSCFDKAKEMGIIVAEYPSHTARYWEERT